MKNFLQRLTVKNYQQKLLFAVIMMIAVVCGIFRFGTHPGGLNQDEASMGYDAWSLLNYGVDRNGMSWPVHFRSWGSGQNALYAYLTIPFIQLFGLNEISVRLVNLICGILAVAAIYSMMYRAFGNKTAIAASALAAIAPWRIMLSRWGLESNLFPAVFLFAMWALTMAQKKRFFYFIAAAIMGLSLYAYGSAYLVITLFAVVIMCYYLFKKLINLKEAVIAFLIYIAIAFPIYLFVMVNLFDWETMKIWIFTIPKVESGRMLSMQSGLSLGSILNHIWSLVLSQSDGHVRNAIPYYGCYYLISLPFCVYGGFALIRKRSHHAFMILCGLVCSFTLFLVYSEPSINRVNAIYFPLIICTAVGLAEITKEKLAIAAVTCCYMVLFAGFCNKYFNDYEYRVHMENEFAFSLGEALVQADKLAENEPIYVTGAVNMPYIYALFYHRTAPHVFYNTVKYQGRGWFERVDSYANYHFYIDAINQNLPGIYVLENGQLENAKPEDDIYRFEKYSVVVVR